MLLLLALLAWGALAIPVETMNKLSLPVNGLPNYFLFPEKKFLNLIFQARMCPYAFPPSPGTS